MGDFLTESKIVADSDIKKRITVKLNRQGIVKREIKTVEKEEIKEDINEENMSITQMNLEEMMQIQDIEPPKPKEEEKKVDVNNLESAADSLFDF